MNGHFSTIFKNSVVTILIHTTCAVNRLRFRWKLEASAISQQHFSGRECSGGGWRKAMKKLLLAIVCPMALGVAAPASAADMPVKGSAAPAYSSDLHLDGSLCRRSCGLFLGALGRRPHLRPRHWAACGDLRPVSSDNRCQRLARWRADRLQLSGQLICVRA